MNATPSSCDWHNQVRHWIDRARQYPPDSKERKYYLTKLIRIIEPKLWKFYTPYYADALQLTWEYFVKNICTTFNPDRASVITWLNRYLYYRHKSLLIEAIVAQQTQIPLDSTVEDDCAHVVIDVESKSYGSLELLDQVLDWVITDSTGVLRQTHLKGRPDIHCQSLILLRLPLPPATSWKEIAVQCDEKVSTLASFYQRQCLPRLRQFGETQGWL